MFQDSSNIRHHSKFIEEKYPKLVKDPKGLIKYYTSTEEEYDVLKHSVGIRDISNHNLIKLYGSESLEFLNRISTNDLKNLDILHSKTTLFLNEKGRFIDRALLLRFEDHLALAGSFDESKKLLKWLDRYIIMEKITIEDATEKYFQFQIIGPQAESFLTLFCGKDSDELKEDSIVKIIDPNKVIFVSKSRHFEQVPSYLVLGKTQFAEQTLKMMFDENTIFDMKMIGEESFNIFRVEKGIPVFGAEINDEVNPHENGLISDVSFNKGCYIGQEVIARLDTYDKVQKELKGFVFETNHFDDDSFSVLDDKNEEVGRITSIISSIQCGKKVGIGFLKRKADPAKVKIKSKTKEEIPVRIVELPIKK